MFKVLSLESIYLALAKRHTQRVAKIDGSDTD